MDSSCFACLGGRKTEPSSVRQPAPGDSSHHAVAAARTFTFEELAAASSDFKEDCRIGRGLYKGYLKSVNQVVAIKQHIVDRHGSSGQGNRDGFLAHVMMLSALRHPNVVNFIGFCADGDHRILVHDFMPLGSLQDHLHGSSPHTRRLDWKTRMKIAAGVAKGLEYVHDKGVVYRGFRCSDILLGDRHHPKLSGYGLEEPTRPVDDRGQNTIVPRTRFGIPSPEYMNTGVLSARSDVYSFGVVLLEIITGRRAIDDTLVERRLDRWVADRRCWSIDFLLLVNEFMNDQRLFCSWITQAQPLLKDRRQFPGMADPAMQGRFPRMGLQECLEVASMCLRETPAIRPTMGTVAAALARLADDT